MEEIVIATEEALNDLSKLLAEDHPDHSFSREDLTRIALRLLGLVWAIFRRVHKDDLPVIEY